MMKVYVVFFKSIKEPYMVLEKAEFKQFEAERNMDLFEVFRLPEKEAIIFFEENSMDYESFKGYCVDYGEVVVTYQDEEMYNENFSIFLSQYRNDVERAFELLIYEKLLNFTDEEANIVDSYFHKIFNTTIKPEEVEDIDPEENVFDETKLMIDTVLVHYGFIRKGEEDE